MIDTHYDACVCGVFVPVPGSSVGSHFFKFWRVAWDEDIVECGRARAINERLLHQGVLRFQVLLASRKTPVPSETELLNPMRQSPGRVRFCEKMSGEERVKKVFRDNLKNLLARRWEICKACIDCRRNSVKKTTYCS